MNSEIEIDIAFGGNCVTVNCDAEYEYEREEKQTHDCPGSGARVILNSVTAKGINLYPLLDKGVIEEIEEYILVEHEERARGDYEDAMLARQEARKDRDR